MYSLNRRNGMARTSSRSNKTAASAHRTESRLATRMIAALLVTAIGLTGAATAHAGAAAAAAAAASVVEVIGGLSSWIDDQSDDCAVAALGAAWGNDCNLKQEKCKETGWSSALCSAEGDNSCAHGWGQGLAQEDLFGSWAGVTIKPWVSAWTKPLHNNNDKHGAKGWAEASVDGSSRAKTEETPFAPEGGRSRPLMSGPAGRAAGGASAGGSGPAGGAPTLWPEGTVLVRVTVDTLTMSAVSGSPRGASFEAKLEIDGEELWAASASLDGFGGLTTSGAISSSSYTVSPNPANGTMDLLLLGYEVEIPVDTLAVSFAGADSVDLDVHFEVKLSAEAEAASEGYDPFPVPVSLEEVRENLPDTGEPMLMGTYVRIMTPLVALSDSPSFGPFLDNDVTNGTLGVGLVDPFQPPHMFAGDLVEIVGLVTHNEGRTVLVDLEAMPLGQGEPIPAPMNLTIPDVLFSGEALEGMPVEICGLHLVDPSQWPGPGEAGLVRVIDDTGEQIDLIMEATTGIGGTAPQPEPFSAAGIVTQYQPEGPPYHDGYMLRLRNPEDLCQCPTAGIESTGSAPGSARVTLDQNEPNPFNPSTSIGYSLDRPGSVRLRIYSTAGRLVQTLVDRAQADGAHLATWDGRHASGARAPSGVYFYELEFGGQRMTRKMLLTK